MRIEGDRIIDEQGRTLILRGCNLGGDSKVPYKPDGATWRPDSLLDAEAVSFIGRPFPLEEADEHFSRLARWGFLFLRLIITWEAIEHAGPGLYDEAYLSYIRKILKKAENYGIHVFIDPHQDVWSRWTGGDGAPLWTLTALGMDPSRLYDTGAALTHQGFGSPFPRMCWPTNYNRYAAATMFTLFFAGDVYAPKTTIDGDSVKDWLQKRYFAAMRHAYRRWKDCSAIVGWGTMNEPHPGFIGYKHLERLQNCPVKTGPIPNAFQAMAAASGFSVEVPIYKTGLLGIHSRGIARINSDGLNLFKDEYGCPWEREGVWKKVEGEPVLQKADYFARYKNSPIHFADDFLKPFLKRFAETLREVNPNTLIFIEGVPEEGHPHWLPSDGDGYINAFHCYDGPTLFTKSFRPWFTMDVSTMRPVFGRKAVRAVYRNNVEKALDWTKNEMGGMPCLLGEFGLPFDLNGRRAYRTGAYHAQAEAADVYYDALDSLRAHSTIWNYAASNSHKHGDNWNEEDLSIWSIDDVVDSSEDAGARGIDGWRRPYPIATAGRPLNFHWDRRCRHFEYSYIADPLVEAFTEIYAPSECFESTWRSIASPASDEKQCFEVQADRERNRFIILAAGFSGEIRFVLFTEKA